MTRIDDRKCSPISSRAHCACELLEGCRSGGVYSFLGGAGNTGSTDILNDPNHRHLQSRSCEYCELNLDRHTRVLAVWVACERILVVLVVEAIDRSDVTV